jgi:general secretion pathway protein C
MTEIADLFNRMGWVLTRLPSLTSAVFIVLIAYLLASLTWRFVAPQPSISIKPSTQRTQSVSPKRRQYGPQIAQLHLFGKAQLPKTSAAPAAPETRLNLTLRGVYATDDEDSMAIIASGANNEKFYHVGDSVMGGTKLKAVYVDRVLLERNNQLETLRLPKGKDVGMQITRSPKPSTIEGNPEAGAKLSQLRKDVLKNPEKLGKMVRATPTNENGRFVGYRLSPRGDKALFSELGLQAGDIVTAVNNIQIDRPEKGLNALQNLINAEEITVTLLRNGSEITIQHRLNP